jgi:hypothetical protein
MDACCSNAKDAMQERAPLEHQSEDAKATPLCGLVMAWAPAAAVAHLLPLLLHSQHQVQLLQLRPKHL